MFLVSKSIYVLLAFPNRTIELNPQILLSPATILALFQDLHLKNLALTSSSDVTSTNPMNFYKVKIEDSARDREEHLSPVSVLEPLFTDDDFTNPRTRNTLNQPGMHHMKLNPVNCLLCLFLFLFSFL